MTVLTNIAVVHVRRLEKHMFQSILIKYSPFQLNMLSTVRFDVYNERILFSFKISLNFYFY